ncbi:MAG: PQQ-dependent sugar dehydrogenase [Nitriliruptor sp.]|uniref:PQQ-dependent sugar dehydrogenase n=1 Tax=Nitriliruptor sp. TaxID=2448056 RepID=UPI0034A07BD5
MRSTAPHRVPAGAAAATLLLAVGCGPSDAQPDDPAPSPAATTEAPADPDPATSPDSTPSTEPGAAAGDPVLTDVASGLAAPWDVAWLGDRAFVTERDSGRLLEIADDGTLTEVRTFAIEPAGEGGLLGLTAHPGGSWLYAYLTTRSDNRVVRFDPDTVNDPEVIVDGIPAAPTHDGGRLAFGPDGMLFIATGDAQDPRAAQDESSLAGKILRVTPDGDVPDDNPTEGSPVWSLGHRNVQGLAFDVDGRLFAPEFGPDRDDEINRIEPGANHGWPEVTGAAGATGFTDPILVRQPPEASWSGGVVLTGGAIDRWEGDLFVAALRGERLYRIPLEGGEVAGEPEELLVGELGRLRDVTQAPDGSLWLLTSNRDGRGSPSEADDRIVRFGPPPG